MATEANDPTLWLGILALVVVELGLITPPVGLDDSIIASLSDGDSMRDIFKGVIPFFSIELLHMALPLAVPALTLTLPYLLAR